MNTIIIDVTQVALQAAGVILAVDLASGFIHWLEDSYGKASWPILGKHVVQPNIKHHFFPRAFTKTSFLARNSVTLMLAGGLLLTVAALGALNWMWVMAAVIAGISNEIHCWAHRSPRENGPLIRRLQKWGILQSAKAHAVHHTDPKNCSYCTVTNYLNPILDRIDLWAKLERVIARVFGVKRRVDESVRPKRKPQAKAAAGCACSGGGACALCLRKRQAQERPVELAS